jgi:hypothetical protein
VFSQLGDAIGINFWAMDITEQVLILNSWSSNAWGLELFILLWWNIWSVG